MTRPRPARIAVHAALILYTLIAVGPILLILVNAFKTRRAIFGDPTALPGPQTSDQISAVVKDHPRN